MSDDKHIPKILVVDDDSTHRIMLVKMISQWGWQSEQAENGLIAVQAVEKGGYGAVLMDVRMARMDGMEALKRIKAHSPAVPVIIMTAYSSIDSAVEAIKAGALDYLTKPLDFTRLHQTLKQSVAPEALERTSNESSPHKPKGIERAGIIGKSPAMVELMELIARVAPSDATVLINGESGTGKELVATALHLNSKRASGPLIKVNCAALVENLLESELFGHEKGAFTGADRRREGKFLQAHGGSIFLDEISETSPAMQAKLLRVLQEHEIQRVGSEQTLKVDVRVIAASNRVLADEVKSGRFREDLFYRLDVVSLLVPPLRERAGDIELLANFFLHRFAQRNQRRIEGISPGALRLLLQHHWPGNVRELENAMERGVILARGEYLSEKDLPLNLQNLPTDSTPAAVLPETLEEAEKLVLQKTLAESKGNRSETARRLKITRKTLLSKIHKYGLE